MYIATRGRIAQVAGQDAGGGGSRSSIQRVSGAEPWKTERVGAPTALL